MLFIKSRREINIRILLTILLTKVKKKKYLKIGRNVSIIKKKM